MFVCLSFGQMIFSILAYGCLPQANFAMKFMQTFCQQYDKIDCKNMVKKRGDIVREREGEERSSSRK